MFHDFNFFFNLRNVFMRCSSNLLIVFYCGLFNNYNIQKLIPPPRIIAYLRPCASLTQFHRCLLFKSEYIKIHRIFNFLSHLLITSSVSKSDSLSYQFFANTKETLILVSTLHIDKRKIIAYTNKYFLGINLYRNTYKHNYVYI